LLRAKFLDPRSLHRGIETKEMPRTNNRID
jgi:hypothetical protein